MGSPRRLLLSACLVGAVLLGSACASEGDSAESNPSALSTSPFLVGPDAFARRIETPGVVTINVHTPDEGAIAGTDLTIPFDQVDRATDLPADRDTPLAVYCRSGNMSIEAVDSLEAQGYTDIAELDGGFNAWSEGGRPLEPT